MSGFILGFAVCYLLSGALLAFADARTMGPPEGHSQILQAIYTVLLWPESFIIEAIK